MKVKPPHMDLLPKDLGMPNGKKMRAKMMAEAMSSKSVKMRKRAKFAMNAKKWPNAVRNFNDRAMNGPLSGR